jgi:hypothetical protein
MVFLLATASRPTVAPTQPPIQWVQGLKWQEHDADHSSPLRAPGAILHSDIYMTASLSLWRALYPYLYLYLYISLLVDVFDMFLCDLYVK